jgi:hypothetical protein
MQFCKGDIVVNSEGEKFYVEDNEGTLRHLTPGAGGTEFKVKLVESEFRHVASAFADIEDKISNRIKKLDALYDMFPCDIKELGL